MIHDVIILGGGIAGLYTAYQILHKTPSCKILILEKETVLGGRIHSYKDRYMSVEAGAGRFHSGQKLILQLIRELGFGSKIIDIKSDFTYIPAGGGVDGDGDSDRYDSTRNTGAFIRQLKMASKKVSSKKLREMSFLDFAGSVLPNSDVEYIKDSFGYYTELVSMNAHDALYLMTEHLSGKHQFHVLSGGLSQVVDALEKKLGAYVNTTILKRRVVETIRCHAWNSTDNMTGATVDKFEISCLGIERKYYGKKIVCALPKQVIEKIPIFRPLRNILEKIVCGPLCRIYSKFPLDNSGKPWFQDLSKITTNNNLRMIIPADTSTGVLMSSYTDNKFAKYWKKLYDRDCRNMGASVVNHYRAVNHQLVKLLRETTGKNVPEPISTKVFYWDCGVGYWGVGANSSEISRFILKPFEHDLFICGEHFSEKNQQWMEGALETSQKIVEKIFSKDI